MPTWKNQRERPLGSRSGPQFRSTKKARTSVLQPKGIFCQHSDSVLKWFSSRALQFDHSWLTPWLWPVKPIVEKLGKTTQPSDMQKYEIINLFVEVAKFMVIYYSSNRKLQELISRVFFVFCFSCYKWKGLDEYNIIFRPKYIAILEENMSGFILSMK